MNNPKKRQVALTLLAVLGGGVIWQTLRHVDQGDLATIPSANEFTLPSETDASDTTIDTDVYEQLKGQAQTKGSEREAMRRENWKHEFPWKPTTDTNVVITQEVLDSRLNLPVRANHGFLKAFFENEARFSPQFEQMHHILEEYGRADNPVAAGQLFQNLWLYHQAMKHDPESIRMHSPNPWTQEQPVINRGTGKPITWGEESQSLSEGLVYHLAAERKWPDKETMSQEEAFLIRDRLVSEIQGLDKLPDPTFAYNTEYEHELQVGDNPLVPTVGWQRAYDHWEASMGSVESLSRQGVGSINELLDHEGQPIIVRDGESVVAALVTPDGQQIPLNRGADGRIIIPTPKQIEAMNEHMNAVLGSQ